jgi:hypothetical protein
MALYSAGLTCFTGALSGAGQGLWCYMHSDCSAASVLLLMTQIVRTDRQESNKPRQESNTPSVLTMHSERYAPGLRG